MYDRCFIQPSRSNAGRKIQNQRHNNRIAVQLIGIEPQFECSRFGESVGNFAVGWEFSMCRLSGSVIKFDDVADVATRIKPK